MFDREHGFKAILFSEKHLIVKGFGGFRRWRDSEKAYRRMQIKALKLFSVKYKKRYFQAIKEGTKRRKGFRLIEKERDKIIMRKYF